MARRAGLLVLILAIGLTVQAVGGLDNVFNDPAQSWDVFKIARGQSGLLVATVFIMISGFLVMLHSFRLAAGFFAVGIFLSMKAGLGS